MSKISSAEKIQAEIEERFGFFPPFFEPALSAPEVLGNLWQQTLSAYVTNPVPALFKERLFAYLSRYCSVPYCIICHSCALRPLGMKASEILKLLAEPATETEPDMDETLKSLADAAPLQRWPEAGSPLENAFFDCSVMMFLKPYASKQCREEVKRLLPGSYYSRLIEFLAYVKTCHLWVEAHPELSCDADKRAIENLKPLIEAEPRLARFFEDYGERVLGEKTKAEARFLSEAEALKKARADLAESEERYNSLLKTGTSVIVCLSPDRRIIEFNHEAERLYGAKKEDVAGKDYFDLFLPDAAKEAVVADFEQVLSGKSTKGFENEIKTSDGKAKTIVWNVNRFLDSRGRPAGVIAVGLDVTDIKKMEQEILKTQKLESIGLLAGGIAHDFNNLLTAIIGNIFLAKKTCPEHCGSQRLLAETEKAALKARDLTQQLLTFARGGAPVKTVCADLNRLVREAAEFVLTGTNVTAQFRVQDPVPTVEIDEGQINQVISNLVINAVQAMPGGGRLTVTVETHEAPSGSHVMPKGDYIKISVEDTGTGIDKEHIQRIFDPFFTTKDFGSGLGLSTAYSIVKNHNGFLTVKSEPGHGSAFEVYLPVAHSAPQPVKGHADEVHRGRGKILVMDDEDYIREVTGMILKDLGYDADFAGDGKAAVEAYENAARTGDPYDLVIMDLTIPGGMGGAEAAQKILKTDPQANIIVSSGYSNDPIMADYHKFGFKGVVVKPYKIAEFSKVIKEVLSHTAE